MRRIRLGRTDLAVGQSGFGAIPIQRIGFDEARHLLRKAFDEGVDFFDTARAYTDSEEKIGYALADVRKDIVIATKSMGKDKNTVMRDLETSLKNLKTDYIDVYQLHNPERMPDPDDPDSLYGALLEARAKGMIRFIGITNHRVGVALEAVASGAYDTVQFPLSSLSSVEDLKLIAKCRENDVGLIAMKALSGGLITNTASAFAFLRQYDNVVPIWGIQRETELDQFLGFEKDPPVLDEEMWQVIEKDRRELGGSFCRACGYCLPCPVGIYIPMAARMSLLLRRMPYGQFLDDNWRKQMLLIKECQDCGQCKERCPYQLDTPNLLREMLRDYEEFYETHTS
ncbi:MAG: aldo/keto reductase [Deltaproteobacteria bacterium]|nr:aldo/keto reductase [Deltaproteobacteria bacterium]